MPSCVMRYCRSHSRKSNRGSGVSFHRFLKPDQKNRDLWIKFVQHDRREEMWYPSDHSCICSLHFKEEDKYMSHNGRIFLKPNAVPSLNSNPVKPELSNHDLVVTLPVDEDSDGLHVAESMTDTLTDSLMEPLVEPEISNTLSSAEFYLRKRLYIETKAKRHLSTCLRKVRRQNRYLTEKCKTYQQMIETLKQEIEMKYASMTVKPETADEEKVN